MKSVDVDKLMTMIDKRVEEAESSLKLAEEGDDVSDVFDCMVILDEWRWLKDQVAKMISELMEVEI